MSSSSVNPSRHLSRDEPGVASKPIGNLSSLPPKAIVIGASTGGPQALEIVLRGMASVLIHVPVFIVLHIPAVFNAIVANHVARLSGLPTHIARHGEEVRPGHIYFSSDNLHLEIARRGATHQVVLSNMPPENFCRPSVDVLFRSASQSYGPRLLGIVLTGMGADGLAGSRAIVGAGGTVIAQDEASSTVWGMPGSVVHEGLARAVLPLQAIAPTVCNMLRCHLDRETLP